MSTSADQAPLGHIRPTLEEFRELARDRRVIPVTVRLLADSHTPIGLYRQLSDGRPGTFLLESAAQGGAWARYSFIGVNSAATLSAEGTQAHWMGTVPAGLPTTGPSVDVLAETMRLLHTPSVEGLPFFSSGMVGYVGWEAVRHWEKLPHAPVDDLDLPEMAMNLVTDMAVMDNVDSTVTLIANAINFDASDDRVDEAWLDCVQRLKATVARMDAPMSPEVSAFETAPATHLDAGGEQVKESWDESAYLDAIAASKDNIVDGDVFQLVLARRFEAETTPDPLPVYRMLRSWNPSPYMYLFNFEDPLDGRAYHVVGSSPEALVTVHGREAITHPIAGSRPRGDSVEADKRLEAELLADTKERSEHLMLVDLARNDLSKVCVPGTVSVSEFMHIERFSHIMHLVSTVVGELKPDATAYDALRATFPAGTLSGAPKPRALQLIDEYEPVKRGVYGGVAGYLDFAGNMDMAIAIRTALIRDSRAYVQAGGGIVADSVDTAEALESLNKARAPLAAAVAAKGLRNANDVLDATTTGHRATSS